MKRFILFFSAALLVGRLTLCAEDSKPQGLPEQSPAPAVSATPAASAAPASPEQSAAQPSATPEQPAAAQTPSDVPAQPQGNLDQPISLIPEALPNPSKKSGSDEDKTSGKHSKTPPKVDYSADAVKKRIRLREVKTKALQDDRIQAEMGAAQAAKTDPEKREALKRYYNLLCDQMIKIDSSLKTDIEARRATYINRYNQNRVRTADEPSDFDLQTAR